MLLTIDIENKMTSFGVFSKEKMLTSFAVKTDTSKSIDEIKLTIRLILSDKGYQLSAIDRVIISSVVPDLNPVYEEISKGITGLSPILISSGVKTGINIRCENPKDVGSDRIIRAVAASSLVGRDVIVIHGSSITTIDYINKDRQFLGGLILPGIDLLQKSLARESAKLPQVEIRPSEKILGNNTVTSIQSGIYYGYNKAISGIVDEIIRDNKLEKDPPAVVATGAHADIISSMSSAYTKISDLGLVGLKIIYDMNQNI